MRIFDRRVAPEAAVAGELRLTYEWRQKTRFRATVARGELAGVEVGLQMPRGTVLRDGDCVASADGTLLRVGSAVEQLLQVQAADALELARIAYHLGNRHVAVQVGSDDQTGRGWLRLALDHVLENMVLGLGGVVEVISAAFDPESGAYGHGAGSHGHTHSMQEPVHAHGLHDDRRHAPKIHDFLPASR
jgi:urease accessory protein